MVELRKARCAMCGARYWKEEGYDDSGELIVDYCNDRGQSLEEDSSGNQICGCGHRLGQPAPRQRFYVGYDGVEYPEVN